MSNDSLSKLLYHVSALDKPLLANAMGLNIVLSGAVSFGLVISSLTCSSPAPRLIPNASKYSDSFSI